MNTQLVIYILTGLIVLFALTIFFLFVRKVKREQLEPKIIELITEAEDKFDSGNVKFEYVFDRVYNIFAPKIVKILFSSKEIRQIIQYVFDKVKIALDYKGE